MKKSLAVGAVAGAAALLLPPNVAQAGAAASASATCRAQGVAGAAVFSGPSGTARGQVGYLVEGADSNLTIDAVAGEIDLTTGLRRDNRYYYRISPSRHLRVADVWDGGTAKPLTRPVWITADNLRASRRWAVCEPSLTVLSS